MTLRNLLMADLARQYHFDGRPIPPMRWWHIVLHALRPRFAPIVLYRLSHALYRRHLAPLGKILSMLNFVLFGIEIALRCEIGEGLFLPHTVGTVIGAMRIGKNAVIYHNVTFGAKEVDLGYQDNRRPVVGDNVIVGSGAKVLGSISIGNNVTIGANAVVLDSVPNDVTVAGIPARIVKSSTNGALQ